MPSLTLFIRDQDATRLADWDNRCPTLGRILSRGTVARANEVSSAAWICASTGVRKQTDWPVAALLAGSDAGEDDRHAYWLCVEPVHLDIVADTIALQRIVDLDGGERKALFTDIREHLRASGMELRCAGLQCWYIACGDVQDIRTHEPVEATHAVGAALPTGKDAARWRRLLTELQMVLHDHPVNAARDSRRELPVNSLWFWGGGKRPTIEKRFSAIVSNNPLTRAIAARSDVRLIAQPVTVSELASHGPALVEVPVQSMDTGSLAELEHRWLAPAWASMRSGRLDEITIVIPTAQVILEGRCNRKAQRRFWTRSVSVRALLDRWAVAS